MENKLTAQEKIWKLLTRLNHQLNDWDRYYLDVFQKELNRNGLWSHQDEALENIFHHHTSAGGKTVPLINTQDLDANK